MIYFPFKNYEEFKELFGIVEHGNGVKSRKNKILLSLFKEKFWLRNHIAAQNGQNHLTDLLACANMVELKNAAMMGIRATWKDGCDYRLELNGQTFRSDKYETDDWNGLCEDGTVNAIRYYNNERESVFKMKAGKMFNHILACSTFADHLTEAVKRYLSEEFVGEWIQYASENLSDEEFTLHVDDDFDGIYSNSRCKGYFGSCMQGHRRWTFYRDAVNAKAAYLTNADDMIVARCIIFTDVRDEDDNVWRLAERQYSSGSDLSLQRKLIAALIKGKHIDGYKAFGSSCSDATNYVDVTGESLREKRFRISCNLELEDTLSFQDTFKWYDIGNGVAYNYAEGGCDYMLDTTSSQLEENHDDDCWSDYHSEYIPENDAYYVETRDDYFYYDDVVTAQLYYNGRFVEETCFIDDCIRIGDDYYYAGRNCNEPYEYGIGRCEECDEYFVLEDSYFSDITEEDYCSEYCMESAERRYKEDNWYYSEYDDEYYEDSDDVVDAMEWSEYQHKYVGTTISRSSLDELIESGEATEYEGDVYIDKVTFGGEPAHVAAICCVA